MSLQKITVPDGGFVHGANRLLNKKCRVYVAKGTFETADIPATKVALKALYEGASLKFVPLGTMDKTGSEVDFKTTSYECDFYDEKVDNEFVGTLQSMTVNAEMITFCDSLGGMYSLLFVPDGDDATFFALNGISMLPNGKLPIVNDKPGIITFNIKRTANLISDVIKIKTVS